MSNKMTSVNGISSPSKRYKRYGKFIDLGLAQGIKQNRKFVTTAATGLAVVTNDSFCDELGITPKDPFALLRYIVYKATGKFMPYSSAP